MTLTVVPDASPVAIRTAERLKAVAPALLGLAAIVATNTEGAPDPVTVGVTMRNHPPPDHLMASALRAVSDLCQALADTLTTSTSGQPGRSGPEGVGGDPKPTTPQGPGGIAPTCRYRTSFPEP